MTHLRSRGFFDLAVKISVLRIWRREELFFTTFWFFFLLTVSDDVGETLVVDHGFTVDWSNSHHTVKSVLGETIGLAGKEITEVVLWDFANIVWVKHFEGINDGVFWISTVKFVSQHLEENGEVDGTGSFGHHVGEFFIFNRHATEGSVGGFQIILVNETITIGINHFEGFFEFLDLRLLEA